MHQPKNQPRGWLAVALVLLGGTASASVEESYDTITEYQHIELSSQISVAGHRLCQDGQHIYFRDKQQCLINNRFLVENRMPHFDCSSDLQLAPISELELIHTKESLTLQRFYNISLQYLVRKKQRIPGQWPITYKTVLEEVREIERCANRLYKKTHPLLQERSVYSLRENFLVRELLKNGIYAVNKSRGQISSVNHLVSAETDSLTISNARSERESHSSSDLEVSASELFQLRTPYCSGRDDNEIRQLIGGWGGGGSQSSSAAQQLEDLSQPLEIIDLMTSDLWNQAEKGGLSIQEPVFNIRCL